MLRFPSLRELHVECVAVESMDLFDEWVLDPTLSCKPSLRAIALGNIELEDESSMLRFLERLQDSTHPLVKTLHLLRLAPNVNFRNAWYMKQDHVDALCAALVTNRVLEDVEVGVGEHVEGLADGNNNDWRTGRDGVLSLISETCSRQTRAPRDEQRSAINRARRLAFLRVVHGDGDLAPPACKELDTSLIHSIFELSAPHGRRSVSLTRILDTDIVASDGAW